MQYHTPAMLLMGLLSNRLTNTSLFTGAVAVRRNLVSPLHLGLLETWADYGSAGAGTVPEGGA